VLDTLAGRTAFLTGTTTIVEVPASIYHHEGTFSFRVDSLRNCVSCSPTYLPSLTRFEILVLHKLQPLPEPANSSFPISFAARPRMRGCLATY